MKLQELSQGVAIFIFNDKQEILLLLRKMGGQVGFWEVPTGHIKDGEDKINAIKREVKEEVDLDISDLKMIGININENLGFEATIYKAEKYTGTAKNLEKDQHENMEWFALDKLPSPIGSTTNKGLEIL